MDTDVGLHQYCSDSLGLDSVEQVVLLHAALAARRQRQRRLEAIRARREEADLRRARYRRLAILFLMWQELQRQLELDDYLRQIERELESLRRAWPEL